MFSALTSRHNPWLLVVSVGLAHASAIAQHLPPPTRTVYKCQDAKGKVTYTDEPCLQAQKIDVQPTRGLDKSSGRTRTGADVQRERHREAIAEAVRPLTGMDAKQFDRAGRRQRLSGSDQALCVRLDRDIPRAELQERQAAQPETLAAAQQRLLALRTAYRRAGCE